MRSATGDWADLEERVAFAARIATLAGERLLGLRATGRWKDERTLGDVADQAADGFIQGAIAARWPDDGVLSEETADSPQRLAKRCVWIVDPLDGTKEYRSGRHDWAVHVGLAVEGEPVLGAVALPAIGRVLAGIAVPGREQARVLGTDGDAPTALASEVPGRALRLAVSRSHTPEWIGGFARSLGDAELVPIGSVGFKVASLLLGFADLYAHKAGLKEWDTCAPEAVARAAGWTVSRLDGTSQRYNQQDARNDEILVCRPSWRERAVEALALAAPR